MANVIFQGGPDPTIKEAAVVTAAITPGMLIQRTTGGVQPHGTADGAAAPIFAKEQRWVGDDNIDSAYAVGDNCIFGICQPGTEVYAFLETGNNVALGAALVSNGAGALQAPGTATPGSIVAYALEALNNASGSNARIKVEVA